MPGSIHNENYLVLQFVEHIKAIVLRYISIYFEKCIFSLLLCWSQCSVQCPRLSHIDQPPKSFSKFMWVNSLNVSSAKNISKTWSALKTSADRADYICGQMLLPYRKLQPVRAIYYTSKSITSHKHLERYVWQNISSEKMQEFIIKSKKNKRIFRQKCNFLSFVF